MVLLTKCMVKSMLANEFLSPSSHPASCILNPPGCSALFVGRDSTGQDGVKSSLPSGVLSWGSARFYNVPDFKKKICIIEESAPGQ